MTLELELVIDAKAVLGEGPCWDQKKQLFYWVDIIGENVHIHNPENGENLELSMGQMVGAIVPRKTGGAIVALENGFHSLNLDNGKLDLIADPERHLSDNRFNDGKCDPAGRFWAGTLNKAGKEQQGALYCLEKDFKVTKKIKNVTTSNGLAWSPDYHSMYFIDTPTKKVVRYEYDLDTGTIENPMTVVQIPEGAGSPDGMTIDEEGMLWIAHWGGSKVSRWNPATGKQLNEISVPALNVTSCTFGGENLNELYITTARDGTDEDMLKKYPKAGGVFKMKLDVKGLPTYQFGG